MSGGGGRVVPGSFFSPPFAKWVYTCLNGASFFSYGGISCHTGKGVPRERRDALCVGSDVVGVQTQGVGYDIWRIDVQYG